jgi:hypothetical protein
MEQPSKIKTNLDGFHKIMFALISIKVIREGS